MAGKIFINYRRGDDPGYTTALFLRLEATFGRDRLFMDVEGYIKAGDDFVNMLNSQVAECDILLAVIGPRWLAATDEQGRRRLDNPEDFVRVEIVSALEQAKRVIPVLVGGASIPRSTELPSPLKPLVRKNAVRLTHERFPADCQGLIKDVEVALAEAESVRAARTETERRAAEELAWRRQEEEAARAAEAQRQAEERARQQAVAGLSAEEIRKAEELANWEFIKSRASAAELRNHLARFPGGVTARYALAALEDLVWAGLGPSPDMGALNGFLAEFPEGTHAGQARAWRSKLEEKAEAKRAAEERKRRETEDLAAIARESKRKKLDPVAPAIILFLGLVAYIIIITGILF